MDTERIINLDNLREICGGEGGFTVEIINLFLAQTPAMLDEIELACLKNDIDLIKKKAHKFKSSAYIFGINRLVEILLLMENNGLASISKQEKNRMLKDMREISELACEQLKEEMKNF